MKLSPNVRTFLIAIVAILAIVLLLRSCTKTDDPSGYIRETYTREASLDEDGVTAYVAASKSPSTVASEISDEAKPLDRRASSAASTSSGDSSGTFLQYSDKIVALFPYQGGTKIMLGDYRRAHSHYYAFIGGFWSSTPSYGGGGSTNRGGGIGGGK